MRLLARTRPNRHGLELEMLALPAERLGRGPRLQNEIDALVGHLARLLSDIGVGQMLVWRSAQKQDDDAPLAHRVEHRNLFGDAHRIGEWQQGPQKRDLGARQNLAQRARHDERVGRQHVGRVMMLRDADPVEAKLFGPAAVFDASPHAHARDFTVAISGRNGPNLQTRRRPAIGRRAKKRDLHTVSPRSRERSVSPALAAWEVKRIAHPKARPRAQGVDRRRATAT